MYWILLDYHKDLINRVKLSIKAQRNLILDRFLSCFVQYSKYLTLVQFLVIQIKLIEDTF